MIYTPSRTGSGQNMQTVPMLGGPIYDGGHRLPRVRTQLRQVVRQPSYPLYEWGAFHSGLGAVNAPGLLTASAPIVSAVAAPAISTAATGVATGAGSIAGPVGAGIALLIGVIAGLWSAHNARVAGAKAENQAINSAVQTWDAGMRAIFAAANSSDFTQNVSGPQAANQVEQLFSTFWQMMSPYMHAPGTADASGGGSNCGNGQIMPGDPCSGTPGGHPCGKSCTATCCVGCADLYPSMLQAVQVLNSPTGGSVKVCTVYGSSYGAQQRAGYTLTFTPPTLSASALIPTGLTSTLSSLFGGGSGSPGTTGTSNSGSLLPLLAIGALAFFLLR